MITQHSATTKLVSKKFVSLLFVVTISTIFNPCPAKADIAYTFIKMVCDPSKQSATITAFNEWNDAGKARSGRHEENIYYLNDIGSSEPQKYGKKIKCDLGNGRTVAFAAHYDPLPKNNRLVLYFDGNKGAPIAISKVGFSLGYGKLALTATTGSADQYILKYCPETQSLLRAASEEQKKEFTENNERNVKRCKSLKESCLHLERL